MSQSLSSRRVPLDITAASDATEIFVIDSRFRRLARGVGRLQTEVPPGYYKIRFRAGDSQRDQFVEVGAESPGVHVHGDPVEYRTAIPIEGTATSREKHAYPAQQISQQLHASPGTGSRLFVFSRDLTQEGPQPWEGVTLHAMDGSLVADLADGDLSESDRFAGLSLEVDPGTYRLRVDSGRVGIYEMFVVTCAGWQTQVFAVAQDFAAARERVRRMALRTASVLMVRPGAGFQSQDRELRLADLARIGLGSGRKVVREKDLDEMLTGKREDPMLGIYGGHLLLLNPRPNHQLIEKVLYNLHQLVGPHPDVLALTLRSGAATPPEELEFATPPMLKSSWDLIVHASRRRVSIVPPGSPADRVADGLLPTGPWLLRRVPEVDVQLETDVDVSFSAGRRLIERIAAMQQSAEGASIVQSLSASRGLLSPLERSLLTATRPIDAGTAEQEAPEQYQKRVTVSKVLSKLDAPSISIARSASTLMDKLGHGSIEGL